MGHSPVNNRDNIKYPFNDSTGNYGKIVTSYVDNHPPEEFTKVRDGGNYGWPFANPNPDTASGYDNMPFDLDLDHNEDGSMPLESFDRISKGIQAHSAPLGILFLQQKNVPAQYRNGVILAYHGSWNRSVKTGYKVAYFPWNSATNTPGDQEDFISGWLDDASQTSWGRPVDVAVDGRGDIFVSDDASGTIFKVSRAILPTPTPTVIATSTPTRTAVPTSTATPTRTPTSVPTTRPSSTPTPRSTATPRPSATATPRSTTTPRPSATATPRSTTTPRPSATATPRSTTTPRPSATATPRSTATPRPSATATPTQTPSTGRRTRIIALAVYNADTGRAVQWRKRYLRDGMVLSLRKIGTANLSIRAFTSPSRSGSVSFTLNGAELHVDNTSPYTIAGEERGLTLRPWRAVPGEYTLSVTPFSGRDATGTIGRRKTVRFIVKD